MYYLGIDLGGTNIAVGVVDESYNIIKKKSTPTLANRDGKLIIQDMARICKEVVSECGLTMDDIEYAGIATPGTANSETGVVEYANNLPFVNFPIADLLKEYSGVKKVYIENDANAAAKAEALAGAAKGSKYSVMITLGTGLGGGIVIDGKVYSGFNFAGAELGHIVIEKDGKPCSCGRRGCWEAYSSATALIRTTKEKIEECAKSGRETVMTKLVADAGKVSGRTAFDGMRLGDAAATEVVNEYVEYLASGLASMINIAQPEVLSIGGGVSNEGQYLLDLVVPKVLPQIYGRGVVKAPDIRIATLRNDAGIIGAAVLGL